MSFLGLVLFTTLTAPLDDSLIASLEIAPGPEITLADALRQADARNLSVQASRAQVEEAQAQLSAAWAQIHPSASGSVTWTHNDHADQVNIGGGQIEIGRQDTLRGNLQVNALLIDARAWFGIGAARANADIAHWNAEQLRQGLLLTVAQAYFSALSAHAFIEVQQTQLDAIERHLSVATLRHRTGTGRRIDVIRAQTDRVMAQEDLVRAHTLLANARDMLARLIQHDQLPMPAATEELAAPGEGAADLAETALREREDLRALRSQTILADKLLMTTWMSFMPTVSATWQLNQQLTEPVGFGSQDTSRWFIGVTLNVPLYDYSRYADLDKNRAALRRVELKTRDAEAQVSLDVRNGYRKWGQARTLVGAAETKVALAREGSQLAQTAYENGTGGSLEVTDAQRTRRQAEINLVTSRLDAHLALLELLRVVGTDMMDVGDT
jgi:outer membrane protein TolC